MEDDSLRQEGRLVRFKNLELFEMFAAAAEQVFVGIYDQKTTIIDNKKAVNEYVNKLIDGLYATNSALLDILSSVEFGNRFVSHSLKVTMLSVLIGKVLDFTEGRLFNLGVAAFLHDVGKAKTNNQLINSYFKNLKNDKEINLNHPEVGSAIVGEYLGFNNEIAQIVLHHHEQPDGQGFPSHLISSDLSLSDKILFTSNFIDNMLYKMAYPGMKKVIDSIKSTFEKYPEKFDPKVTNTVLKLSEKPAVSRRKYQRYILSLPARYKLWQDPTLYNCRILDLSGTGAKIRARDQFELEMKLKLSFSLTGVINFNDRNCKIVWRDMDDYGFIYGIEFADKIERSESNLNKYIEDYLKKN